MKKTIPSNLRPLLRALCAFLIAIAAPWAVPKSARAQLYVIQRPSPRSSAGIVSEYDAETGAAINANFIIGLSNPEGLAVLGNALFVANSLSGTVGEYDATTGGAINASFIMGLFNPDGLALLGNKLFVTDVSKGTVGEYDATRGAAINANFITGLSGPLGLAVKSAK